MANPYASAPNRAFWRRAVANAHVSQLSELFAGLPSISEWKVATAGSCFAQHIGRALRARDLNYLDLEPAPANLSVEDAERLGFGIYSCRYGNIYTPRQLLQLFEEAFGERTPVDAIWEKDGRQYDALRPGVEPDGFGSAEEVTVLRKAHLEKVRIMFTRLDLFVFTLGLTEAWMSVRDGTVYPTAPGVIAGKFDASDVIFKNFRYPDIWSDLTLFIEKVRRVNPGAQFLFTVSPVPLAATATNEHVLVATTYSKSTLRAVAGDLASQVEGVSYFPSYELIASPASRGMFFHPDMRTVSSMGVAEVMKHFFHGAKPRKEPAQEAPVQSLPATDDAFVHCEESLLDAD